MFLTASLLKGRIVRSMMKSNHLVSAPHKIFGTLVLGLLTLVIFSSLALPVSAGNKVTTVTVSVACDNGVTVDIHRDSDKDFTNQDYIKACGANGYTKVVSRTVQCDDGVTRVEVSRPKEASWTNEIFKEACKTAGSDYTVFGGTSSDCNGESGGCIISDIQLVINVLSIGVGVVVTIMIVLGGLQYMTSRDNPQAVQAAKTRITNAVIGLVAFVFVYSFLQWLVPGGIF